MVDVGIFDRVWVRPTIATVYQLGLTTTTTPPSFTNRKGILPIIMTSPPPPSWQELIPAFDPEPNQVLTFSIASVKKAISQALEEGINGPGWLFFSGFSVSRLKALDKLRLPIRVGIEPGLLIIRMVSNVHEMMHTSILVAITAELVLMGLRPILDFDTLGATRYQHHMNPNSQKEADSSVGPATDPPWPALVIEAGWSEGLAQLRRDANWWLSAQLPPNDPRLIILITFQRAQRTFLLEKYQLIQRTTIGTRSAPTGSRAVAASAGVATIDLRTTPPTVTGVPFVIPFKSIMRRDPVGQERDISLDGAYLSGWAVGITTQTHL